MAREEMKEIVLAKLEAIQEGNDNPVWVSGIQMTQLLKSHNPSSIRMALLLLMDDELVVRDRRKGRGKTGKTGQSSWYAIREGFPLEDLPTMLDPYDYRQHSSSNYKIETH